MAKDKLEPEDKHLWIEREDGQIEMWEEEIKKEEEKGNKRVIVVAIVLSIVVGILLWFVN